MGEKISFDVDWDALFPGKPFTVANKTHSVTPLNIESIARIVKKVKIILPLVQKEGINLENITNPEMIIKLVPILMDNTPDIVAEMTGISVESLVKFPPQYLLEVITIAIDVNLESKESLEKNFDCLIKTFQNLQEKAGMENLG